MSAFQAVNTSLAPESFSRNTEDTTPTTPRPSPGNIQPPPPVRPEDVKTPTRATFGALANQKPLPDEPFTAAISVPEVPETEQKPLSRGDSQYSNKSRESDDVDMDESDGEDGSDEETINEDGTRSTKKKKSQRFWCNDFPPCNLSFTRSEHLARHIRKHTGERPFQCHCSRRFSRLDNLRQHAQTVHVNEDIPGDSLAATGTRFQRQVRTDRVRPPGANRARASTNGSQSSQTRGHTRNSLSASSISSVGSAYSQGPEQRRRPPPLVMAGDPGSRTSMGSYTSEYRAQSPGGFSTPTSATFSTQNSPRWSAQSPTLSHSRTASIYAGHRTPGRRLSVPSGANPFQSPMGYQPSPLTPMNASSQGFMSPSGSIMASPTASTTSTWSRRSSVSSQVNEDYRRRTWHPETHSNFTSRLMNVSSPYYHQQPPQQTRLPGIESFDPLRRPVTPPRREPSPMVLDTPSRTQYLPTRETYPRPQTEYGMSQNMHRLDIAPRDGASAWASDVNNAVVAVQAQAEPYRAPQTQTQSIRWEQPYRPRENPNAYQYPQPRPQQPPSQNNYPRHPQHSHHVSAPITAPLTPRESKRQGWYNGPVIVQNENRHQPERTSPEGGSSSSEGGVPGTPGSAYVMESQPSIVHASSYAYPADARSNVVDPRSSQQPQLEGVENGGLGNKGSDMQRLEVLVAAATSAEGKGMAAY